MSPVSDMLCFCFSIPTFVPCMCMCSEERPYVQPSHLVTTDSEDRSSSHTQRSYPTPDHHPSKPTSSWVIQRKADIPRARPTGTRSLEAARGTHGPSGAHALLPAALGDVDRGILLDGAQREQRRAGLARGGRRRAAALGDRPGDAAADGQLGHVLVVENDLSARRKNWSAIHCMRGAPVDKARREPPGAWLTWTNLDTASPSRLLG